MPARKDQVGSQPTEAWTQVEAIIEQFETAWQAGRQPNLEEFLPADAALRRPALVELVHADLEYRLKAGEAIRVETYLKRFSEIANDRRVVLDLLTREYELRRRREPTLSLTVFLARFPQLAEELERRLQAMPAEPTVAVEKSA